ncbi:TrkH family potassium uptake protein [Nocardioides seonyuensis]|uniref:TrkH family potassium uptake protein n=1 Tax=Nocardioides seonyuensis TaxID=2518371 RepID=A0A4V1BLV8_9ACTN|nr:potassium transporter TrkG [Nocardioides seonyuensis]QBX54222.1 TrkH family potassium uptake protein [Nocardioides seonyuensis]
MRARRDVLAEGRARRAWLRHPAQLVVAGFLVAILAGTLLLMLPLARSGPGGTGFLTALFHATSAVCVTGLVTVDTPVYWSTFGEVLILALIQVGGFGIMTLASLLAMLVWRRLGLRSRMTAAVETKAIGIGEVRTVIRGVLVITVVIELLTATLLTFRFALAYDEGWGRAAYLGVFHAVSAFNNAGFALYSDSLIGFVDDPWVCLPIALAVIAGGLGFPVWLELIRHGAVWRAWSLHTTMTVSTTVVLLVVGTVFVTANEWGNPGTLGSLDTPGRILAGFFHSVMPRTAGFNAIDYAQARDGTLLGTSALMFIGGGSAGTAGGIKITTFVLLFWVIWAEARGERDVEVHGRRIDDRAIRQALTVALLGVGAVMTATLALVEMTDHALDLVLFEAVSAFATVGLSAGITDDLPAAGQLILIGLMFLGRLGPITLVSALALRERGRLYRLPEGRPLIG